jgi:hypothetical protein
MRASWVAGLSVALALSGSAITDGAHQGPMYVAKIIAPSGHLRAAINYGNPLYRLTRDIATSPTA